MLVAALSSCNVQEPSALSDSEICFCLGGLDMQVTTKATVDTVTTANLGGVYWMAREAGSVRYGPQYRSLDGAVVYTGEYWPVGGAMYDYCVSNVSFSPAGVITATNDTDIVAGAVSGVTSNYCTVVLDHIFARTGALTVNAQGDYTISDVSWYIRSRGAVSGTAGSYVIGSGWSSSGVTALAQRSFDSSSDLYLIPGEYTVGITYTATVGHYTENLVREADVTLQQGMVSSITALVGGDAREVTFRVSVTPWGETTYHSESFVDDPERNYLTFEILTPGTLVWTRGSTAPEATIQYSLNGGAWTSLASSVSGTPVSVAAGDVVRFKGANSAYAAGSDATAYNSFTGGTARFNVSGNIKSLLTGDNFLEDGYTVGTYAFAGLFDGCETVVSAENLVLCDPTKEGQYYGMFTDCTALVKAPALSSAALSNACYQGMFAGCTALTATPEFPSTVLATSCYDGMFVDCTALRRVADLPATDLKYRSYHEMFAGCTALVSAPVINMGTSVFRSSNECCLAMFESCTSLVDISGITFPSANLSPSCFANMFQYCSALRKAPALPATILKGSCYDSMFAYCSSLSDISDLSLPASVLPDVCYNHMFMKCTSLSEAPAMTVTQMGSQSCNLMYQGCTSLVDVSGIDITAVTNFPYNSCAGMFQNCTSLTTALEMSPATVGYQCFGNMYQGCSSLTDISGVSLPATTLSHFCYSYMFASCVLITSAPALPATTLAPYCYRGMFYGCRSLAVAPALPATTLADYCYHNMFQFCSSLTAAPALPATTLAPACYYAMFGSCSSLTSTPDLPATTLAQTCYSGMFTACTSVVTAGAMAPATVADYCCNNMFQGCTALSDISAVSLPATTLADRCYESMFKNCQMITSAPELPATILVSNCYRHMFMGCSSLTYIKALFLDPPSTSFTQSWVASVPSGGTFVKNASATWNVTGEHGVPTGWTIQYE